MFSSYGSEYDKKSFDDVYKKEIETSDGLHELALTTTDESVLIKIASHPKTETRTLRFLANHTSVNIRNSVAKNLNTPGDVLTLPNMLSSAGTHPWIVVHPNTPEEVLIKFVESKNEIILRYVVSNPNASAKVLDMAIREPTYEEYPKIRFLNHKNISKETVLWALRNSDNFSADADKCLRIAATWPEHAGWPTEWLETHYGLTAPKVDIW